MSWFQAGGALRLFGLCVALIASAGNAGASGLPAGVTITGGPDYTITLDCNAISGNPTVFIGHQPGERLFTPGYTICGGFLQVDNYVDELGSGGVNLAFTGPSEILRNSVFESTVIKIVYYRAVRPTGNGLDITPATQARTGTKGFPLPESFALTADDFTAKPTFTISPPLPSGLSIDPDTGVVSGTPTAAQAETTYTITATNGSEVATSQYTLTVSEYTVLFQAGSGGTVSPTSIGVVAAGDSITLPTPTKPNNSFNGWFTAATGGTLVGQGGEAYVPTATLALYAQWTPPYTVTINRQGGTGTPSSLSVAAGDSVNLPTQTNRSALTFAGWFDSASGSTKLGDAGDPYTPPSSTTIYAQWNATLSYSLGGGSLPSSSTQVVNINQTPTITLPTPTRSGYAFKGWYSGTSSSSTKFGNAGDTFSVTENDTIYAQWTPLRYATFNPGDYGQTISDGRCVTDPNAPENCRILWQANDLTLPAPTSPSGLTFDGWWLGLLSVGGAGDVWSRTPFDAQLVSRWTGTITFNPNGGAVVNSSRSTRAGWTSFADVPYRPGYAFVGWFDSNASLALPRQGRSFIMDSTDTWTASWQQNPSAPTLSSVALSADRTKFLVQYSGDVQALYGDAELCSDFTWLSSPKDSAFDIGSARSCTINGSIIEIVPTGNPLAQTSTALTLRYDGRSLSDASDATLFVHQSGEITVPLAVPPETPTNIVTTAGDGQVSIFFTPAGDGGSPFTGFTVTGIPSVNTEPGGSCQLDGSTTQCIITGLTNGIEYSFAVVAANAIGNSPPSTAVTATPVRLLSHSNITVEPIVAQVYTGVAQQPTVTINDGSNLLSLSSDYTISYTDNINVGQATITLSGIGAYGGSRTVNFNITPKPLTITGLTGGTKVYDGTTDATVTGTPTLSGAVSGDDVTIAGTPTYAYESADVSPDIAITATGFALDGAKKNNYSLSQPRILGGAITPKPLIITGLTGDNKVYDGTTTATATGTPALNGVVTADVSDVSITGTPSYTFASADVGTGIAITTTGFALDGAKKDNYTLSQPTLSADITAKPINDQSITIDAIADQAYTGTAITPTAVVKDGSTALVLDTDYTVAYADNTDVGTATITISGKGNYGLSREVTFEIKAGLPAKPTALAAEAKDQAVTLSWTAPTDIGGSAITGYTVSATPGSATCTTATTSCTVSDLTNGTEYTFTVVATNEAGNSPASDSVKATPKADAFVLTVTNGTGSGSYAPNREVSIAANPAAEGKVFDRWVGDVDGVENINNPNTSVIVGQAITVEATYKDQPQERYTLTLNQGRGAGEYLAGATVTIAADPAPIGQIFDQWIGDAAANLVNPNKADTQFIMPASNATLTARYKDRPDEGFSLVVNEGTGDGTYLAGDLITVAADPADEGWVFVRWSGDADTLANENLPNTLLTMPSQDVTLTPLYEEVTAEPEPHTLTVASGTGDGDYLPGRVVLIAADVKQDMIFDRWVGQTSGINNINLPNTTLVMGRDDVSIEATFKPDPAKAFVLTERVRLPSASAQTQTLARSGQTAGSTLAESTETVQGERDIEAGRLVALLAPEAPDGFVFDKWVGQTSHIDNIHQPSTYLYMPDKAVDVIATYRAAATAKALVVTGGSGDGDYLPGTEVAIKADTAPTGFVFDKWVGQTAQVANVNRPETTLLMPATTVAVEAIYRALPSTTYPLVVQGGTGDGDYEAGSSVVLDIPNPPKDQIFARWTGQVGTVEDVFAAKTNLYMPATEVTVVAAFDPLYTVTASVVGVGGSVSPASQQVLGGETASITITTETGFEIKSITGCGDNGSLVGQTHTTAGIEANCALSVTFEQVMPEVKIEPVAFGQISCALNPVSVGGGVLCTAIPEDGSVFVEWAQCGGVISGNTCLLTDLDGDLNVAATFESVPAVPVNANQRWALWSLLLLLMLLAHRHMRALRLERAH